MQERPKISEAEWEVMKVLWGKSPQTANQVVQALTEKTSWKPKTIKTLLNRLAGKKAIGFEKNGREYLYKPLLSEDECVRAETRSFIDRTGPKALKPMLAAFIEEQDLSDVEITELRQLLEQKGKE